jgi:hypothetical protein
MVSPRVFDPEEFLTTVGTGRTSAVYKPKDYIFRQALNAMRFSISRKGHVELVVLSEQGWA